MRSSSLSFNKYLPAAILYFFLNGVLLPLGVLYTTLLTPVFLFWLWHYPSFQVLKYFFYFTIPLFVIHYLNGIINYSFYFKSYLGFFCVYVFCMAFYQYLQNCHSLRYIFKKILILNAFMVVLSLVFLYIPYLRTIFWYNNDMSLGSTITLYRLKMLTYEPSYYCTLFAPIVIYYMLKAVRKELPRPWLYFCLVLIPLFLSLSFGVILSIALAMVSVLVWDARNTIFSKKNITYILGGALLVAAVLGGMAIFHPDNVLFRRMANVFNGRDLSFNGRTLDSFKIAMLVLENRSHFFGVGFGQVKILAFPIFEDYYHTNRFTMQNIGIPNAIGDLFATLGLVSVILKLYLEFFFFFRTKVSSNYYRLIIFLFIFIYQFTGSFIINIAEYAAWMLAFCPTLFPEFNKVKKPEHLESPVYRQSHAV
jgi:hypothetical protein